MTYREAREFANVHRSPINNCGRQLFVPEGESMNIIQLDNNGNELSDRDVIELEILEYVEPPQNGEYN